MPCQGHDEDAGIIRSAVEELLDAGKDVLLVVHSYGSIPACDAIVGLSKTEREAHGRAGGVVALVYIAAFILPEGASLIDGLGGNDLPWWDVDVSHYLSIIPFSPVCWLKRVCEVSVRKASSLSKTPSQYSILTYRTRMRVTGQTNCKLSPTSAFSAR